MLRKRIKTGSAKPGSVMLIVLLVVSLSAAVVIGILQLTTEQALQVKNQIGLCRALGAAEAGLHDAYAQLRQDSGWSDGFADKTFFEDSYTVTVSGSSPNLTLASTGQTDQNYRARLEAEITVGSVFPHTITVQTIRINE